MPAATWAHSIRTDIAIVGAGPAGLMLALELGCRGVACAIFDKQAEPPAYPKANATSARTMEHYRRRGLSERVRSMGMPEDHPQDVVYTTRLTGIELARFLGPSSSEARSRSFLGDFGDWASPEMPHRVQQMYVEAMLRDELRRYPSITTFFGISVDAVAEQGERVQLLASNGDAAEPMQVSARYVVGCDGGRSMVRAATGISYVGEGAGQRELFGGQMASIYVHSAQLAALLPARKGWQYWFVNNQRRGLLVAIDGREKFALGVQLAPGQTLQDLDVGAILDVLVGQPFEYELLSLSAWTAGFALVAERFRSGRIFLAGDSAHLFTPSAGMGYNTSVDDAVNLGWKLAAVVQGWAGPALLDSYETERQPIAYRNTAYASAMADSMASLSPPADIESAGAAHDAARAEYGARCKAHVAREYNIAGLQLGVRYESGVVAREVGAPPPDSAVEYVPSGYPGARAPHVALAGSALFDHFGRDFTLLCTSEHPELEGWKEAAARLAIPLALVSFEVAHIRDLYGADLVLIRPDSHIAWRGDSSVDPDKVLRLATAQSI
jgi:2-polyprenyl-6-methoxyphenol hydroxylase-like FAD-dependent oxidoreductase